MLGIVVSSSSPAVAARCAHVRAGVGAAAIAERHRPAPGPGGARRAHARRAAMRGPRSTRSSPAASTPSIASSSLLGVTGEAAACTGAAALGATERGSGRVRRRGQPAGRRRRARAMIEVFGSSAGEDLGDRLMAGSGPGSRGRRGRPGALGRAAVADDVEWPIADLRVDWHDDPISELERAWDGVAAADGRLRHARASTPRPRPATACPANDHGDDAPACASRCASSSTSSRPVTPGA